MSERYTIFPAINPPWTGKGRGGHCDTLLPSIMTHTHTHTSVASLGEVLSLRYDVYIKSVRLFRIFVKRTRCTWHDDKGSLWLHGNQAHAEDAGGVRGRDATHSAHVLQTSTQRLQVSPVQQNAPVWDTEARQRGD